MVVRLDTEIRISESLKPAFFLVRNDQKYAALLYLLREVIRFEDAPKDSLTVIFVQTRHHAEVVGCGSCGCLMCRAHSPHAHTCTLSVLLLPISSTACIALTSPESQPSFWL